MAERFKTKYIVNYYCWIIFFSLAFTSEPKVYTTEFYKAAIPNYVILNNVTSEQATSIIECAIMCLNHKCSCYSFNKLQQRCHEGTCTRTNTSTGVNDDIYVQCNTAAGFKFVTSGSVTACIWVSTKTAEYVSARDDCKAKGASLFTVRTKNQLRLLKENFVGTTLLWIGLNDIDVEGVFRFEDDYTICNATCIGQIFEKEGPNDSNQGEDCVVLMYNDVLNDLPCTRQAIYVCELPFFNWP